MAKVEMKLELIQVPVSDVDRAKSFYVEKVGFNDDHDHQVSDEIRFVQLTPPGSACSIALTTGAHEMKPGSIDGIQLVVEDADAAQCALSHGSLSRGVAGSILRHPMAITVYGAGAIGGVTGAALARAGHDVLLVDRAVDHVNAMNAHGLTIDRPEGSLTVPVRAITPDVLGGGLDLVLLSVKSQDTPAALEVLTPRLASSGAIVSLQNGLNEELIATAVGSSRTVGCLVNWAADWTGPGRILHGGQGAFVLGELDGRPSSRVASFHAFFELAGSMGGEIVEVPDSPPSW